MQLRRPGTKQFSRRIFVLHWRRQSVCARWMMEVRSNSPPILKCCLNWASWTLRRFVASVEEADVDHILESLEVDESGVLRVRAEIRANLERDLAVTVAAITRVGVLEQLVATYSDFDLPKGLVELEIKARSASSSADELSTNTPPADDPKRLDDAQSRVRAFILLAEVARQNSITPEQSRINTTLAEIASDYDEPRKVVELYARDSELMATLRNRVIEEQTIDWLLANARVSEHRLSTAEVMQAQP